MRIRSDVLWAILIAYVLGGPLVYGYCRHHEFSQATTVALIAAAPVFLSALCAASVGLVFASISLVKWIGARLG